MTGKNRIMIYGPKNDGSQSLPGGSLSVLVGRQGAMNPAGRARIRNIMPIVRDYSGASQSF
jgi:hypothetical protein